MDGVAILIRPIYEKDDIMQDVLSSEERTEIFVSEKNVSGTEFFSAGRNGINADKVLITARVNYNGESQIEYNGVKYDVYRSYSVGESDEIELYLGQKGGVFLNG